MLHNIYNYVTIINELNKYMNPEDEPLGGGHFQFWRHFGVSMKDSVINARKNVSKIEKYR
jgi:hypothetical protein